MLMHGPNPRVFADAVEWVCVLNALIIRGRLALFNFPIWKRMNSVLR